MKLATYLSLLSFLFHSPAFMAQSASGEAALTDQTLRELTEEVHRLNFTSERMYKPRNRALLGVYPEEGPEGQGVRIDGLVRYGGAGKAGLQAGDILLNINGAAVQTTADLHSALLGYEPGETISVRFLRNETEMDREVTLTTTAPQKDPCQVFIGVYTTTHSTNGEGLQITGVIPGTPAENAGLQRGDRILAMDGNTVANYSALLAERDKHRAGDPFRITLRRAGQLVEVQARFNPCEMEAEEDLLPDETAAFRDIPQADIPIVNTKSPQLELESFRVFPNPTFGRLTLRFAAEPGPVTIRISDVSGRTVFERDLPAFSGQFAETIDLETASPGLLTLCLIRLGKVYSEKILLLDRA